MGWAFGAVPKRVDESLKPLDEQKAIFFGGGLQGQGLCPGRKKRKTLGLYFAQGRDPLGLRASRRGLGPSVGPKVNAWWGNPTPHTDRRYFDMGVFEISMIFCIFCVVWIITNILWKLIEGKMMLMQQEKAMDMAYAKAVKLILRFKLEMRGMKNGADKM